MPAFLQGKGLTPEQLGVLFAAGTAIRLVSGPLCGRLADLTRALRAVLAACSALAGLLAAALLSARGFPALVSTSVAHAAALAPVTTLADALALRAAAAGHAAARFEYGWVRGTGSAVFILGTLVSGQIVGAYGLASIIVLHSALLVATVCATALVPTSAAPDASLAGRPPATSVVQLLGMPRFRRLLLVSALVLGSHAMHDAFAVIRWTAAGVTPAMASALWSESVAAEVIVFFLAGPWLVQRLGPPGVVALAAMAGAVRWVVAASTTNLTALALVQPLHGLTFAALHLACMRLIAGMAPHGLAATAQAMYALGAGATTALLTLASGRLYATLGAQGFLVMALLCACVPPLAPGLRSGPRSAATDTGGG
jgi:PPP family 3-phenylpropionic acid transporter